MHTTTRYRYQHLPHTHLYHATVPHNPTPLPPPPPHITLKFQHFPVVITDTDMPLPTQFIPITTNLHHATYTAFLDHGISPTPTACHTSTTTTASVMSNSTRLNSQYTPILLHYYTSSSQPPPQQHYSPTPRILPQLQQQLTTTPHIQLCNNHQRFGSNARNCRLPCQWVILANCQTSRPLQGNEYGGDKSTPTTLLPTPLHTTRGTIKTTLLQTSTCQPHNARYQRYLYVLTNTLPHAWPATQPTRHLHDLQIWDGIVVSM
ncbi:hypothetical protein Pmani_004163 [Petrolisthes manimaculis]|uniref:Uncharacterized protein n=1 Tax=Petrolisthes manimaculis TaxID=1843537 RepID=A0AAE1UHQ8_9EUCA|nr:hypothetical protein Pmani_004163 [Petrolisthes manimaculis]